MTSSGAAVSAYSTWGSYGSSKAALNHLALTLTVEEPEITTVAIRPGVVDTEMQKEVRGHAADMDDKDVQKFKSAHEEGKLLRPEKPGNVIAKLSLGAGRDLSGNLWK
jgi:NAD(P)-dependent dehydrogenase (short-subunit alcohol dehydrogenase family)